MGAIFFLLRVNNEEVEAEAEDVGEAIGVDAEEAAQEVGENNGGEEQGEYTSRDIPEPAP
jgi:hypothetical protein